MASGYPDWLRAFSMVGKHGEDYKVVLVDELGNLYALLQGETADGDLETVRLDSEGRISAFVIDSTDAWGQMLSIGNAELAARLGSPVLYEQSGRVQFIETFGQGLALWEPAMDGAGKGIELSPVVSMRDGYSAKLTGGRDGVRYAQIRHSRGGFPKGGVGLAFAYSAPTDFESITAMIDLWDGVDYFELGVMLDGVSDKLKVWVHGDDWAEVGTVNPQTGLERIFFFVKVTADLVKGYYKALRFNQQNIPILTRRIITVAEPAPAAVEIALRITSVAGENDVVYLDDIILTAAE